MKTKVDQRIMRILQQAEKSAQKIADAWIGTTLVWNIDPSGYGRVERPYKGRKCVVREAMFDEKTGDVMVIVDTETQDGHGYMSRKLADRIYRSIEGNFLTLKEVRSIQIGEAR